MENQGYLIIGQTESLDKSKTPFHYVAPSIYQKRE
jgi:chemotaxis methyl-accepting protein methylase